MPFRTSTPFKTETQEPPQQTAQNNCIFFDTNVPIQSIQAAKTA